MTDIIGPADAPNFTTSRPADDRTIGATDTWMKDCTGPTTNDGTKVKAAWLNAVIGQFRSLIRGNGNTGGGPAVVTENNADDMALRAVQHLIQRGQPIYGVDSGSANALVVSLSPALAEYQSGLRVLVKAANNNTGAATLNINGLGIKSIIRSDGTNLKANDLLAGQIASLIYDGTKFQLVAVGRAAPAIVKATRTVITATGAYSFNIPANIFTVRLSLWGAGGGGGFGNGTGVASGGSSGSYLQVTIDVTPGATISGNVGAGGAGAVSVTSGGAGGNTTAVVNSTTYTTAGGPGGLSSSSGAANSPALPTKPTTGEINLQGQAGGPGILPVTPALFSGYGGNAPMGGLGGIGGGGQPDPGTAPGGGGGGSGGGGNAGGAGGRGEVWIEY